MYINTASTRQASARSPCLGPELDGERTPLWTSSQQPPSYSDALPSFAGRPSGDEASRLLWPDGCASPQPLSDPLDGDLDLFKGRSLKRRRSLREHCSPKRIIKIIAALVLIVILAAVIAAIATKAPKTQIQDRPHSSTPAPAATSISTPQDYPIRWPSRCKPEYETNSVVYDFATIKTLRMQEAVRQLGGPFKRISGWIHVTRAPDTQASDVRARVSYAISQSVGTDGLKISASSNELLLESPSGPVADISVGTASACLGISVVLYIRPGATFENLDFGAVHLGMQIHEGAKFNVTNRTSISLVAGTVNAPPFNSRETRIETTSGSITGKYALLDLLSIKTGSGSVNIDVDPKEAQKGAPLPAKFVAQSLSGSIRAEYKTKDLPDRDYRVFISTKAGSIDGTFVHGSSTMMNTVAGVLTADILPFSANTGKSSISTVADAGRTKIKVRGPYLAQGTLLSQLISSHKTISGAIDLTYPLEWEGRLDGSSTSGSIHLQGDDLELIDRDERPGWTAVAARKGHGNSTLTFETMSGSCEVRIGKIS